MSDAKRVQTVEELEARSDGFRERYGNLKSTFPDDEACQGVVVDLRGFLSECAEHGRYMPTGTLERRSLRNLVDYWSSRLERDLHAIDDIPALKNFDPTAGVPLVDRCPYPGLGPYDEEHVSDFFGRERVATAYATSLEAQGIFLIIGGSGSGKSSVALAGVRPIFQARHSEGCFPPPIKPGSDPLGALAASIAEKAECDAEDLARRLKESPADAASLLGDKLGHAPILLIIDQFEEVLTLCRDADAQKAFADALLALAPPELAAGGRRFYLLFTLRTDHLGRLEVNPGLKPLRDRLMKPDCHAYLPAMEQDEILQAILKPAQRVRLRFVPAELAVKLAGQTASLTNGLPLLQFALQRLWEGRAREPVGEGPDGEARALDFIHERQLEDENNPLPNVASALGTHAERVYQALESQQRKDICERLILELVFLDESFTEAVRRRRPVAELCEVIGCALGAHRDEVLAVIEVFVKERLLRRFTEKGEDQLEVAHEALLRHWSTINTLVYGDEAKARLFRIREVQKEASDWINKERNPDWLKRRGEPLATVEKDVAEFFLFDEGSKAYVAACRADEERIKAGEKERLAAEKRAHDALLAQKEAERERAEAERQEQERARRRKRSVVGVGILGSVILLAGAIYVKQRNDSNLSASASLSDRLPPWEGLDLTHTLAKNNEIFSGALGHALERMNNARIVGARGSSLTLLADGNVLLSVPAIQAQGKKNGDNRVCLFGLEKNGLDIGKQGVVLSPPQGVCVPQYGLFDKGNIGPEIVDGPLKGRRLFVAIFRGASDGMLNVKAWLIELNNQAGRGEPVSVIGVDGMWSSASQIAIHPGGREVSFGLVNVDGKGQLFKSEMKERSQGETYSLNVSPMGKMQIVNSLGYVSLERGGYSLVLATQGGVSCGEKLPAESAVAIATVPESVLFAVGRGSGGIELTSCNGKKRSLPPGAPKGDPRSVSLQRAGHDLLLSYQMEGGGRQCYKVTEEQFVLTSCNASYLVGTAAVLGKDTQVMIESAGMVPVVRRFPAEFAYENSRFKRVGWEGGTVLCRDGSDSRDDASKEICPETQSESRDAVLSPLSTYKAVMERSQNGIGAKLSVWKMPAGDGSNPDSVITEDRFVAGNVFSINKHGRLAYFRAEKGNRSELMIAEARSSEAAKPTQVMIVGGPTCMSFSPDGAYLLVGTGSGRAYRYAVTAGGAVSSADSKELVDIDATVTACAVADDGGAALGLKDGGVLYFDLGSKKTALTERAVYRLSAEVKAVRIDDVEARLSRFGANFMQVGGGHLGRRSWLRRVTALGAWQPNNCLYPALPGQSLRVWEMTGKDTDKIPISNTCFPNQPVLALGGWTTTEPMPDKSKTDVRFAPTGDVLAGAGGITSGAGIHLLLPQGVNWHPCPACRLKGDSDLSRQERLLDLAREKRALMLGPETLKGRYGLKLGLW